MEVINLYLKEFERNCQEIEGWINNFKTLTDYKKIKGLLKDNDECITYLQTEMPNQHEKKEKNELLQKVKLLKEKNVSLKKEAKLKYETSNQSHLDILRVSTTQSKGPNPFKTDNYDSLATDRLIDTKFAGLNAQMMGNEVGIELARNDIAFNRVDMNNMAINANSKVSLELIKDLEKFRKQSENMIFYSYVGVGSTLVLCVVIKIVKLFWY